MMPQYITSATLAAFLCFSGVLVAGERQAKSKAAVYYLYVTSESEDEVAVIRFDGKKGKVHQKIVVGELPTEIEGPHGLTISPDGKHWYLSMAHGRPFGFLYKFETGTNKQVGKVTLGLFPATMQISKATGLLYVVNFNLHGKMKPSTVSVVDPDAMKEIEQIKTGAMPHGSRVHPNGKTHYSVAMMSGELFEIDAVELKIKRKLMLDTHRNMKAQLEKKGHPKKGTKMAMHSKSKPTWVYPHPDGTRVYVACNGTDEVLEIDLKGWKVLRRFRTDKGPYNVEVTPDGKKMVVTYKSAAATGFWDLKTGKELKKVANTRSVTHGVVISPDNRYAFVSVEGKGDQPGAVDIFDLRSHRLVATVNVGKQAGGIYFWKIATR
ncbi:MAG: YncE family protein [Gemmataceae bacterium]